MQLHRMTINYCQQWQALIISVYPNYSLADQATTRIENLSYSFYCTGYTHQSTCCKQSFEQVSYILMGGSMYCDLFKIHSIKVILSSSIPHCIVWTRKNITSHMVKSATVKPDCQEYLKSVGTEQRILKPGVHRNSIGPCTSIHNWSKCRCKEYTEIRAEDGLFWNTWLSYDRSIMTALVLPTSLQVC